MDKEEIIEMPSVNNKESGAFMKTYIPIKNSSYLKIKDVFLGIINYLVQNL
jgi:hypothetical protein